MVTKLSQLTTSGVLWQVAYIRCIDLDEQAEVALTDPRDNQIGYMAMQGGGGCTYP